MNDLDQIRNRIRKFRDARDWMQFHNPKNLACSISIEANELLEHFQWCTPQESLIIARKKKTEISHEIADVAVYLIELADNLGIDLAKAIAEKMAHNDAKYPANKVRGSSKKYTEYKTAKRSRK
jgi:NTP pyrophosphatase (non-canonical NTP hydrolase)